MSSSFIPHNTQTTEANTAEDTITNNGFFPDLLISDFRTAMRTDDNVSTGRTRQQLISAMYFINEDLKPWQLEQEEHFESIEEISVDEYQTHRLIHLYKDAVYNRAKAMIIENYRDIDSTNSGHDRAAEMELRVDDYLQKSREAVRQLMGKPRMTVELV